MKKLLEWKTSKHYSVFKEKISYFRKPLDIYFQMCLLRKVKQAWKGSRSSVWALLEQSELLELVFQSTVLPYKHETSHLTWPIPPSLSAPVQPPGKGHCWSSGECDPCNHFFRTSFPVISFSLQLAFSVEFPSPFLTCVFLNYNKKRYSCS